MSDRGRYRKVYPRLWHHPGFRRLDGDDKALTLYLLSGPQTNRLGLYKLSIPTAADDLDTVPETLSKRIANVCDTFGWRFDPDARVFYIPSFWTWNPPENPKVLKGCLKDLNEIPPSPLIDTFANNLDTLPENLWETFRGRVSATYAQTFPISGTGTGTGTGSEERRTARATRWPPAFG